MGWLRNLFSSTRQESAGGGVSQVISLEEGAAFKEQANAFLKAGNLSDAVALYRRAVSCNPKDARAHFALGYALREQGHVADAVLHLEAALSIDDGILDAHYVLGSIHQADGRSAASIEHFQKVLDLDPANAFVPRELCLAYVQAGQLDNAKAVVAKGLAANPNAADLHLLSGNLKVHENLAEEAVLSFRKALAIQPDLAEAQYNCGLALQGLGRLPEALSSYDRALESRADYPAALIARAKVLRELDRHSDALLTYDQLVQLMPEAAELHFDRGNTLLALKRPTDALASFDNTLALDPHLADAFYNRALALAELKRPEEALASLNQSLGIKPDFASALINRATVLQELGRHDDALMTCQHALVTNPNNPGLLNIFGVVLQELHRSEEALAAYSKALQILPRHPPTLSNRGLTLLKLKRFDEALSDLTDACEAMPELAEAHANRGLVLQRLGRHQEALACLERALKIRPSFEEAHFNEGICRLTLGDFEKGWPKYEWRRKSKSWRETQKHLGDRVFEKPLWLGQAPLAGKSILLHAEQGLGDTIQLSRYCQHPAMIGAKVFLEVQQPLELLLRDLPGVHRLSIAGQALPEHDFQCPLLSLPLACKTELASIPARERYLGTSQAHKSKVHDWHDKLGPHFLPRIGLVWSGNSSHANDENRSIALGKFKGILSGQQDFYCLQDQLRDSDLQFATQSQRIKFFFDDLTDFSETAALVENLDLVISVDTSVAHLAGALGKAVWLLLPANPDWRWLLGRDDSPWYESIRLFRQPIAGDWESVLLRVEKELQLLQIGNR